MFPRVYKMLVTWILILGFLGQGCVGLPWIPITQDADRSKPVTETTTDNNAISPAPVVECKTARNVTGICVLRERCDFGPGGVDFTLYAPRWYKKPCNKDEACCPHQYIMVQSEPEAPTRGDHRPEADEYFYLDVDDD